MNTSSKKRLVSVLAIAVVAVGVVDAFRPPTAVAAFSSSPSPPASAIAARPPPMTTTTTTTIFLDASSSDGTSPPPPLSTLVDRVAVAGATGRTGKYVVEKLLSQNVPVLALVRDVDKANSMFDTNNNNNNELLLTIRKTDLGSKEDVIAALNEGECDAAIWAATGFSDAPDQSILTKLMAVFGLATNAGGTIDAVGLPALGDVLSKTPRRTLSLSSSGGGGPPLPKVIMLSSAGVTRPDWTDEKKEELEGCAKIPIVRLNPFGILGVKWESEEKLRNCGVEYSIFRPCGLNDSWSPNQRPVFSQGDVAVGRINRRDVASILVDMLSTPEATGKTFEAISIANNSEGYYPPAPTIGTALGRLELDAVNGGRGPSEDVARATYALMQQLLPGEKQEANKLAMGQTYEQLDKGETGRLGERGEEDVQVAVAEITGQK